MRLTLAVLLIASAAAAEDYVVFREPGSGPREQLTRYLNSIAFKQLDERSRVIAAIRTRVEAENRQKQVREKLLTLIGGLPDYRGPLNVKQFGTLDRRPTRFHGPASLVRISPAMAGFLSLAIPTKSTP